MSLTSTVTHPDSTLTTLTLTHPHQESGSAVSFIRVILNAAQEERMDAKTLSENLTRVQAHLQYEVAQTRGLRVRVAALEAQNERLRETLEAARPHVEGSIDLPEHSRDELLERIDAALGHAG